MHLKSAAPLSHIAPITACLLALTTLASAQKAERPCDLFAPTTPCVDAVSTTRALYRSYTGPLYQVTRNSDKTSADIGLLPDGYANAATQDKFCAGTVCTITKIYDQSPNHNDLTPAPPGGAAKGPGPGGYDIPAIADALPATVAGHKVYGISITPGMGYRNDHPAQTAIHGEPEGVYMVTSALSLNEQCCFDYGNAETNDLDNKAGHMDAINIYLQKGNLPDAGLDMEDGIYGHLKVLVGTPFVTVMGASDGQHSYVIYQGNSQTGNLTNTGTLALPKGYQPMQQEGAIILGIGGDNSNGAIGYFYEGVMTKGMPDSKLMESVQQNIASAKYAGPLQH